PRDLERLLRLLAEQSDEHAIMFLDLEGRVTWWSPGAERIFGIPASEIVGQHSSRTFTEEQVAAGMPEHEIAVASKGSAAQDDRWMERANGSRFWAMGVLLPLCDARGELIGFGKILRNRTDIKEQLESLRNQADAAAASNRRKDIFLSTLSHELRNPLAALTDAAEIIRLTAPESPDLDVPLRIINRQVENLRRLVDDLMDLSRIGAGKVELKKQVVKLQEIVERAVESTRPLIRERGHDLERILASSPVYVEADPVRLEQVFVNLLNNAAKYTPEGGKIWVKGTTEGKEAVVHVEDTGIGIPPELLPRIFKLFTQVETSRGLSKGGLGIGLSLVKRLVTLHGGSVQVRSEGDGKGSQFTVRLPLVAREHGAGSQEPGGGQSGWPEGE
ncbi:MAG TPA: PAS domain-containing sensor histidine kinase, partial [Woeseiaceae bacterium]|nr:PAS domain-containing sensor histidine kinase [Woeseiaceae bacterium]